MRDIIKDERFGIDLIGQTPKPGFASYVAMHTCYSEGNSFEESVALLGKKTEEELSELVIKKCLKQGHWGVLEGSYINFHAYGFPHSVVVQARTHRHLEFNVQCLAGNSEITLWDGSKVPIEGLVGKEDIWLRTYCPKTNKFTATKAKSIYSSGVKKTYTITLEDGSQLESTLEHRYYTLDGWKRLSELAIGDKVVTNGETISMYGVKKSIQKARAFYAEGLCLHHNVPVSQSTSQAYDADNLTLTCRTCHAKLHVHNLVGKEQKILSIEESKTQETFDIEMSTELRNFIANGFVVHNSQRYTGERVIDASKGSIDPEDVFYLRPVGMYKDRKGQRVEYTQEVRDADLALCIVTADHYRHNRSLGIPEEQARGLVVQDIRQNFTFSGNFRTFLHFFNLRGAADAQLEIETLCHHLKPFFYAWDPIIADWYFTSYRRHLAP